MSATATVKELKEDVTDGRNKSLRLYRIRDVNGELLQVKIKFSNYVGPIRKLSVYFWRQI